MPSNFTDNKPNILLINHYAGSDEMGMEFRPYYMAKEWSKLGARITILAGSYSHLRSKQPDRIGLCNFDGIKYLFVWTNKYKGNGISRFLSMLVFILQIIVRIPYIVHKIRPNVVIASSTYPLDIFPSWIISKLCKAKLIFEIHDLWPLSLIELGKMSKIHPFVLLIKFSEWCAYKLADKVVSILPNAYVHVKRFKVKQANYMYISNGINIDSYSKISDINKDINTDNSLLKVVDEFKGNNRLILYAGSIGVSNDIQNLLQVSLILKKQPVKFMIIGNGPSKDDLVKFKVENELDNVIFFDRIAKNLLYKIFDQADFLYLGLQKQSIYKYGTSMNKLYDYMLASKPIIAAFDAYNNPVHDAKCGFSCEPQNPLALADVILKALAIDTQSLDVLGQNAKAYVIREFNYKKLAKKFLNFICL